MGDNRAEEELNRQAHLLGFIGTKGNVSTLPLPKIEKFAKKLVKKIGARASFSLFQAQVGVTKQIRTKKGKLIRKKFERGRDTIRREFGKELIPREAIMAKTKKNPTKAKLKAFKMVEVDLDTFAETGREVPVRAESLHAAALRMLSFLRKSDKTWERPPLDGNILTKPKGKKIWRAEKVKKSKENPTNANGRELAPRAVRGELQVTNQGSIVQRNPLEPFFEDDFSGFHLGTGPMVANPTAIDPTKKFWWMVWEAGAVSTTRSKRGGTQVSRGGDIPLGLVHATLKQVSRRGITIGTRIIGKNGTKADPFEVRIKERGSDGRRTKDQLSFLSSLGGINEPTKHDGNEFTKSDQNEANTLTALRSELSASRRKEADISKAAVADLEAGGAGFTFDVRQKMQKLRLEQNSVEKRLKSLEQKLIREKKKNPPDGERRPRPNQGVVDALTDSVESRFSHAGRAITPGGMNRGELQLTSGRGNLVVRNPNEESFPFERDESGFFQTEKGNKLHVLVNPHARMSIKKGTHKGEKGYKLTGKDSSSRKVRIFVPTKGMAESLRDVLRADLPASMQDKMVGSVLSGQKNPTAPFFEDDLSGFFRGTGPRVANPKHKDAFPFERDLSDFFSTGGQQVTNPAKSRIAKFRAILENKTRAKIDGVFIDTFSASAVVQVFDSINAANQEKFDSFPAPKMVDVAFKLLEKKKTANPKDAFPFDRDLSGRFPDESLGESSAPAAQAGGQFDERLVTAEGGTLQKLVNPHNVHLRRSHCPNPDCNLEMRFEDGISSFACPGCNTSVSVSG